MERKYYTVEEANAALPQVRELADHILHAYTQAQEKQDMHRAMTARMAEAGEDFSDREFARLSQALESAVRRFNNLVEKLRGQFGCELKGVDPLLIDFYSMRDDREVFLCWQQGEDRVAWWHDMDTGFAGRQPL